jgi:competence protein ComEA
MEEAKEQQWSGLDNSTNPAETTGTDNTSGKININTASMEQLMEIPGIGEAKAKAIINYRETNGGFSSIEEVMNIEGVKEGVFSKMKEYIVVN